MAHKPLDQLESELEIAKTAVVVGGEYAHYKHPSQSYVVLDLVISEDSDRVAVVYCRKDRPTVKFVRPLSSWQEVIEVDGKPTPRFKLFS